MNIVNEENALNENDTLNNVLKMTNTIIESKKLQMNYLWCNKITQEDLNTPKILDENAQNLLIVNSIFFSIIKYANKTNEIFESIVFTNEFLNEKSIMYLMIITSAIIQKFKNFFSIKTKAFKKEKYLIDPITKLQRYYGLFKINIRGEELSKKIEEFYNYILEFNSMLESDGHLK